MNYMKGNILSIIHFSALSKYFACKTFKCAFKAEVLGKTFVDLEPPRRQDDTYEAYLVKWIGIGMCFFGFDLFVL